MRVGRGIVSEANAPGNGFPNPARTTEQRPLGIPTLADRARQTLVKFALEPEWETRFEANSYGFRPGRLCASDRHA
jgi:retron-type reverse transcriptase